MNLRRFKHTLLRLSLQEKIIGIGSILMMLGSFFPWYSHSNAANNSIITEYGFSGDLGVMGFVIFLMSLMSLLALIAENMHLPFPTLGFEREKVLFFFLGESAFLCLLTMAIHTKQSINYLEGNLRFGIFLVLAASLFSALAAFNLIKNAKKTELINQEEFQEEITQNLGSRDMLGEAAQVLKQDNKTMNFGEDMDTINEIDQEFKNLEAENQSIPEQKNYFTKEAGLSKESEI